METDQTVYEYLSSNLSGKPKDVIDRFTHRIAVFSDFPEMMNIGEIYLKSKLWDYLDEAIKAGITTLYIVSGASDSNGAFSGKDH